MLVRTVMPFAAIVAACGGDDASSVDPGGPSGGGLDGGSSATDGAVASADGATTTNGDGGGTTPGDGGSTPGDGGTTPKDGGVTTGTSPVIAGCPILPADHVFNTPIASLPVHPNSAQFMTTIGAHNLHLDLGQIVDQTNADYFGIPYNVVHGGTLTWAATRYYSPDPDLDWDTRAESDCAAAAHTPIAPCTTAAAPNPVFPIPPSVFVEGGVVTDPSQPYGDHHILLLDQDTCRLWELYHAYKNTSLSTWDIYGSATFDLRSNALRPAGWSSADAAGFPILPLLLRADEASSGTIKHALRFTIESTHIRQAYTWPARHLTNKGKTTTDQPPMGQLFRLKSSFVIPANYNVQAKAILQAMKTYGMYIADGGSDMYVQGEPSAAWLDATFTQVQSVSSSNFEAVDLAPIQARAGFDVNSGRVPPP